MLEEAMNCKKFALAFEGSQQMQSEAMILGHDLVEAQIIADSQEDGGSIWHSH
jgi:hypothetical protein